MDIKHDKWIFLHDWSCVFRFNIHLIQIWTVSGVEREKENREIVCSEAAADSLGAEVSHVMIYCCEEESDMQEPVVEDSDYWW
jgi:hypothetical protein